MAKETLRMISPFMTSFPCASWQGQYCSPVHLQPPVATETRCSEGVCPTDITHTHTHTHAHTHTHTHLYPEVCSKVRNPLLMMYLPFYLLTIKLGVGILLKDVYRVSCGHKGSDPVQPCWNWEWNILIMHLF